MVSPGKVFQEMLGLSVSGEEKLDFEVVQTDIVGRSKLCNRGEERKTGITKSIDGRDDGHWTINV